MRFTRLGGHFRWIVGLVSATSAAVVGYACSSGSSHPAPFVDLGDSSIADGGGTGGDGGGRDSGKLPDGGQPGDGGQGGDASGSACSPLTQDGTMVTTAAGTGTIPTPAGGVIYQGTYFMSARSTFGSAPDTSVLGRTIVVGPKDWTIIEALQGAAVTSTTGTWETFQPDVLSLSITCPGPKHLQNLQYTGGGPQLTLFPTNEVVEVYDLQ
jgi:hypothetical protein